MNCTRFIGKIAVATCAVVSFASVFAGERPSRGASLATVEGVVVSVETISGEGGEDLNGVRIRTDAPEPRELTILLAPESTLRQIEFEVRAGDRIKARVFLSDDSAVLARKVMNVTRGTMVRLRTLTRIPLWDGGGQWQGGPSRGHRGGHGQKGPRH